MMLKTTDVFSHLQPRHLSRRERKPGARERHSAQRQRLSTDHDVTSQQNKNARMHPVSSSVNKSSYSMDSAIKDFSRNTEHASDEPQVVVSKYKELSTIDEIRASMKSTSRAKSAPPQHVPDWMLNLDINLDVTSVDIIPPYIENEADDEKNATYRESPTLTYIEYDSDDEDDFDDIFMENKEAKQSECPRLQTVTSSEEKHWRSSKIERKSSGPRTKECTGSVSEPSTGRLKSNTFKIARSFTPTHSQEYQSSPRRYQGDKRVMSLQQGGIRSTPMQPKSKKYINQMITYNHMKHHDRKLKKAKPAVDTKMPSTFKYALERKQLVETRLSQSWKRPEPTPTPSKSPTMSTKSHSTSIRTSR